MTGAPLARLAGLILVVSAFAPPALAVPHDVRATVLWARARRVYVAAEDSAALEAGDLVTFRNRGRIVAAGEVARVLASELALVNLTSGSLERVKRLDRLWIEAERPPLHAPAVLRLGFPARDRPSLVFSCARIAVIPPRALGTYRVEAPSGESFRLVRDPPGTTRAPWPDTLLVRLYDEATDEEIALERGELDLAIFWPGELSAHLRESPHWAGELRGTRARGVIAARWEGRDAPRDSAAAARLGRLDLDAFNRQLFGGDLVPWARFAGHASPETLAAAHDPPERVRWSVDPSFPGQRAIARFLEGTGASGPSAGASAAVRLIYVDSLLDAPDRLARQLGEQGAAPLFAIGCPVICGSALAPYVAALGPDLLVGLLGCAPPERAP